MAGEGDLVLIYYQDAPSVYARIESIDPDIKKDWYQVTLFILTIPAQTVTWILREAYINGDPFTMGGQPMRLEGVKRISPRQDSKETSLTTEKKGSRKSSKVIPLKKRK